MLQQTAIYPKKKKKKARNTTKSTSNTNTPRASCLCVRRVSANKYINI